MGLSMNLAIARAEMRSVRRLVRYWIFSVLSIGITCLIYLYYAAIHGFVSRLSATVGAAGPRFLISALGIYVLAIFLLGLIFLAFDVRARDERERMAQVLDSRPLSNVELLVGRSLGLVFMAWVPVLVAMSLMQVFGGLALAFGWWLGEPVEPYSLIGFVVFDALTAFAVWCSLIVLLAVLLCNRLLVAISALVLLGLEVWSVLRMPVYLVPALGMVSAGAGLGSDVVPLVTTGAALTQRLSLWVLAAGFVALAAAFHPRPDGGARNRLIAVGAALVLVAGVTIGGLTWRAASAMQLQEVWEQVHRERSHEPRARIVAVGGSVEIDPGRRLDLDLQIRLQAPEDQSLDTLLFAFNPGLRVESVSVGGAEVDWTHALGLLEISLARPLQAGGSATLNLVSRGKPDNSFAYLDSSVNLLAGNSMDAQVGLLGIQSGVFSRRYVALMPGIRWLPYAGTDIPNGDSRVRPADYFEVDLEVEVPRGWLVAGPGKRQTVSDSSRDGDRQRFRFHPGAPVSEVGLLASRFVRRSTEVAGVELELLVNAKHQRNLDLFADAAQVLE
ncbi:MAG: hypothetical protein O7A04_11955, partial [Acidobacteria bacterium]|nr:hypothetical protein [Acidobacteriota bacterium]